MLVPELTPEIRASLKHEQAHRFPELRFFPKPGDDGKDIRLPVVLGNPSGACVMPEGKRASKMWTHLVASTFGVRDDFEDTALVTDCVLWPPPGVWARWAERWPALPPSVAPALRRKYGGSIHQVSDPGDEVEMPPEIATALAASPGAAWLRFEPTGAQVDLAIKAPASHVWSLFREAMKKPDADHWALVLDLAVNSVAASTRPIAAVVGQWPGLALIITQRVSRLAGSTTEFEEGEL